MNDNKDKGVLLIIGLFFIFFAISGILCSWYISKYIRLAFAVISLVGFTSVGFIFCKKKDLENVRDVSFSLAFITCMITYIYAGIIKLFGSAFSFTGEYHFLFISSIFILCFLLSLLCKLKYKNDFLTFLLVSSLILSLFFILKQINVENWILLASLYGVLLILNIFVKNSYRKKYVYIATIVTTLIFGFFANEKIIEMCILTSLAVLNLLITMINNKNKAIDFISLILSLFLLVDLYTFLNDAYSPSMCLTIITGAICFIDLFVSVFIAFKVKEENVVYKILLNIVLFFLIIVSIFNHFIIPSLIFIITAIIISCLLRNNKYEIKMLPLKFLLVILTCISFAINRYVNLSIFTDIFKDVPILVLEFTTGILLIFYNRITKDRVLKILYSILMFIVIGLFVLSHELNIVNFSSNLFLIYISYYFIINKQDNKAINYIYYSFACLYGVIGACFLSDDQIINLIFTIMLLLIVYNNTKDKYISAVSVICGTFTLLPYVSNLFEAINLSYISCVSLIFLSIILFAYLVFDKPVSKSIFMMVSYGLMFYFLLIARINVYNYLFTCVLPISLMCFSYNNKDYKGLKVFSIVYSIIFILGTVKYIDVLNIFFYILIIGVLIMIFSILSMTSKNK